MSGFKNALKNFMPSTVVSKFKGKHAATIMFLLFVIISVSVVIASSEDSQKNCFSLNADLNKSSIAFASLSLIFAVFLIVAFAVEKKWKLDNPTTFMGKMVKKLTS